MNYLFQDETENEYIIRHTVTHSGSSASLYLPKICMDCGATHPREGFAPVFNTKGFSPGGEVLRLVCNSCYDKRCAKEWKFEQEEEARKRWLEKDNHRRKQNREARKRYVEKQKGAGSGTGR